VSANRPPHLLIVNQFAKNPDQGGGTRHLEMGRELVRRGWRVTIAASDFHLLGRRYARRESAAVREALRETVDGVDFRWLWASEYVRNDHRRLANWLTFARSVISYPWRDDAPDIVIGSSPQPFAAVAARRVASKLGVPFLFEVRDLWPESLLVSGRRRGSFYAVLWIIARYLYSSAHRIIVLARGAAEYLAKQGIDAAKIEYIPNGADIASFLAPAVPNGSERLRAVYAGAHGPANGLDTVLEAADLLRGDDRISFFWSAMGRRKTRFWRAPSACASETSSSPMPCRNRRSHGCWPGPMPG
jgi:glycosyltransferase involved in cell wall biosynthesis